MNIRSTFAHLPEAVVRATEHWEAQRHTQTESPGQRAFTIALSREAGARGTSVAREVGRRLGWQVYDQELIKLIAQEMGLREILVQGVDERHVSFINESLAALSLDPVVSSSAYVRHLLETVFSLAAHGNCVFVGRGAPFFLPQETTLRVRLVAPLADRIDFWAREHRLSRAEAEKAVRQVDKDREAFVQEHFRKDAGDPAHYDLVLNVARYSLPECAEVIAGALQQLKVHAAAR